MESNKLPAAYAHLALKSSASDLIVSAHQMDPTTQDPVLPLECFLGTPPAKSDTQKSALSAKKQSITEFLEDSLDGASAREYERTHNSPLLEFLIKNDKQFDGLDMSSPDNTYNGLQSSVRSFNLFWSTVDASDESSPEMLAVKERYADLFDGFHSLCMMSFHEREVVWSHYVSKAKRVNDDGCGLDFLRGTTKRNYLNGQMAGIKLFQQHVGESDNWTWATMKRLNRVLDNTVLNVETQFTPKQIRGKNFADFMDENQISALKEFMVLEAQSAERYSEKLRIWMHDLIQDLIIFGCPRGRKEIANMTVKTLELHDFQTLKFQQLGRFKSLKINSSKVANYKPPRYISSVRAVDIFDKLITHRTESAIPLPEQRLFLRPKDNVIHKDKIWYQNRVMGEKFVGLAVSTYVDKMRAQNHPLFIGDQHFTNTSLRKFHTNTLAEAGAPVQILQESLGHNTKSYTKGVNDVMTGMQVGEIIGGKRKSWKSHKAYKKSKTAQAQSTTKKSKTKPNKALFVDSDEDDDIPLAQLFPRAPPKGPQKLTSSNTASSSGFPRTLDSSALQGTPKLHLKFGDFELNLG